VNKMNIQSMSASAGSNAGAAGASKNAGASGGFQGVLVQKIGAAEPTAGTGTGASNPMLGLAGLLTAALGVVADEPGMNGQAEGGEQLSQLLDTLDDKLGQLRDETDLPDSLLDQLAELLASLQGLLQPNQAPSLGSGDPNGEPAADSAAQLLGSGGAGQQQGPAVISMLANAVKELRTQLQSGQLSPAEITAASESIKSAMLGKLADPTASKSDEKKQAQSTSSANRTAVDETGNADVQPEVKKAFPVFKEPVVYWNLNHANTQEDGEASGQSVVTEPAAAVDEQPVTILWQHVTSDVGTKVDAAAVLKQQAPVTVPGQQFAEQMDKFLVKQFTLTGGNGISEANINLHPEHLGEVQIKLTMQHGQLSAQFVTHNEAAKELLENQMAQLRGSLQSQGIQVDRVEVVQQQPAADASAFMNQERRRQHSGGGGESKGSSGGTETLEQFEEELERTASLKDAGYGGSLNVTA